MGKPTGDPGQKAWDSMSETSRNQPTGPSSDPARGDLSAVKFLTVAEVAQLMRVSKMSVYRLIHSGELEAVRVGRSFRVPERAVDEYLKHSYFEAG